MNNSPKKLILIYINIVIIFLIISCGQNDFPVNNLEYSLVKVSNPNIISGDTIILFGNFPKNSQYTKIVVEISKNKDEMELCTFPKSFCLL